MAAYRVLNRVLQLGRFTSQRITGGSFLLRFQQRFCFLDRRCCHRGGSACVFADRRNQPQSGIPRFRLEKLRGRLGRVAGYFSLETRNTALPPAYRGKLRILERGQLFPFGPFNLRLGLGGHHRLSFQATQMASLDCLSGCRRGQFFSNHLGKPFPFRCGRRIAPRFRHRKVCGRVTTGELYGTLKHPLSQEQ